MFSSENILEAIHEIRGFTTQAAWKKTQLFFYYGVVMAKESFVTFGGNVYLRPENFDMDLLSPRMIWAFRVGSIATFPVHVLAALFGLVFFLCYEIAWPILEGFGYLFIGVGSLIAETLTPYMSHKTESSRVISPAPTRGPSPVIEKDEGSKSRSPSPNREPIQDNIRPIDTDSKHMFERIDRAETGPKRAYAQTANPIFTREQSEEHKAIAIRVLDQRGCVRRRTPSPGHVSVYSDDE